MSTINQSQLIQDSTYLHEKSMSQDINTSALFDGHANLLSQIDNNANKDQN